MGLATHRLVCLVTVGLALAVAHPAWPRAAEAAGYKVIVHPDSDVGPIDREELARLFLKKATRWRDGTRVLPVDLPLNSEIRRAFSQEVLRRTPGAVRAYWQQAIFSGRGLPPPELDGDTAVVAYVLRSAGAIGYVSAGTPVNGVKVVPLR